MRNIWSLLFMAALTGAAGATPSPLPPDSFTGEQYIDGRGCVFTRDGHGWTPRLDNRGKAICGFPPSLSARRTDPDTVSVLPPGSPAASPDPEELLLEHLAAGLRQGEFTADPRPPEARLDPAPPADDSKLVAVFGALTRKQDAIRASIAGLSPGSDLCARLGYEPDPDSGPILGGDVTQGLCPGMRAAEPLVRIITGQRLADGNESSRQEQHGNETAPIAKGSEAAGPQESGRPAKVTVVAQRPKSRGDRIEATASVTKRTGDASKPKPARTAGAELKPKSKPELIPASARYVQVGSFPDDDGAHEAIRKLAAMGYPVARGHEQGGEQARQLILAGPFRDRRSLVAALNLLRDMGYANAVAR
ncbi:SPOR domain-containing protein [Paracoccus methylarcula]|uniref:SPOR domain-containing protein n=1 Tax=Paracoccus methylarcula TaxID=72022 RepID=A0A422R0M7_9RHOB|nr:SPOR domain-containing protein [Paracoccus methylarcula]RNF35751.1 SPOR domain-containing protein [Paracoccus methylarcula]